jgi:hypothetical protein
MTICPECGSNNTSQSYLSAYGSNSSTYTYSCLECNCTFSETHEIKIYRYGQKDYKKCPHCGKSLNIT